MNYKIGKMRGHLVYESDLDLRVLVTPLWQLWDHRKWCPQRNYLLFYLQEISTEVQNVCHEEILREENVNQNKGVKHTFDKTFLLLLFRRTPLKSKLMRSQRVLKAKRLHIYKRFQEWKKLYCVLMYIYAE